MSKKIRIILMAFMLSTTFFQSLSGLLGDLHFFMM